MRIMFTVPKLAGGGAERVVSRLASILCEEHDVHIALYNSSAGCMVYPCDPRVKIHTLDARLPLASILKHVPLLRATPRRNQLRKLKRSLGIDIAISFLPECDLDNVLSRYGGETVCISIRNSSKKLLAIRGLKRMKLATVIRYSARKADKIITVSKRLAAEHVELFGADPAKIETVYNAVDADEVRRLSGAAVEDARFDEFRERFATVVLCVGRTNWQKGQWHLIRAFKRVHQRFPDCGLVIIGSGDLRARFDELVDELGLGDSVLLLDFQENPFAYMGKSDIFVMPSLFEGFSNVLLEAMACGLPVVSADCVSGPRELLAPESDYMCSTEEVEFAPYGVLVPVCSGKVKLMDEPLQRSEELLAEAMETMVSDERLRTDYIVKSAERLEFFTDDRIVGQWVRALGIPWTSTSDSRP